MRLLVLTSSRFGTAAACLPALLASARCEIVQVILTHPRMSSRSALLRQKARKIAKIGPLGALNGLRLRSWYADPPGEDIESICRRAKAPFIETSATNSPETELAFRAARADLGLSLGNSYIAPRLFNIPRLGMVNVHGERLPEYRNAQSVIWPIYNMERLTGISVHQVATEIDGGAILHRDCFPIRFAPDLEDTVRLTLSETRARTPAAVLHVCENYPSLAAIAEPQGPGRSFTTPTYRQFLQMRRNNRKLFAATRPRP